MENTHLVNLIETAQLPNAVSRPRNGKAHTGEDYTAASIQPLVETMLSLLGEDPDREGLKRTPERVARMYQELLAGYHINLSELVNGAIFEADYQDMVLVRGLRFYSMCEHHMLPFFGQVHVAYIPDGKIIGLSKIPRLVEMYARRLQVQERLTQQVASTLQEIIHPRGVAVIVEGAHLCAMMRGVKKDEARMVTSAMLGEFQTDDRLRQDFYSRLQMQSSPAGASGDGDWFS